MFVKSPCIFLDHSELGNLKKNYFNSSLLCFLEQFVIILPITALLLLAEVNVYKKKYFSVFTHLSSRILLRKNGFLLNVENCIELTYWHVKSIQNLSCSDKRMTPLSISLKVKYISFGHSNTGYIYQGLLTVS